MAEDDTPVLVQYPPDPLHVVYLGPANDLLSKLEEKYPDEMDEFYSENKMTKKGQGIGGTFNGPSIKDILKDTINSIFIILTWSSILSLA